VPRGVYVGNASPRSTGISDPSRDHNEDLSVDERLKQVDDLATQLEAFLTAKDPGRTDDWTVSQISAKLFASVPEGEDTNNFMQYSDGFIRMTNPDQAVRSTALALTPYGNLVIKQTGAEYTGLHDHPFSTFETQHFIPRDQRMLQALGAPTDFRGMLDFTAAELQSALASGELSVSREE